MAVGASAAAVLRQLPRRAAAAGDSGTSGASAAAAAAAAAAAPQPLFRRGGWEILGFLWQPLATVWQPSGNRPGNRIGFCGNRWNRQNRLKRLLSLF